MPTLIQTELMIAAMEPHAEELLHAAADRYGAPVISGEAPRSVLKQIALTKPSTLVVQVTPETVQPAVGLIQLVSAYRSDVKVIAACTFHDAKIETACRASGADCYVCLTDGPAELNDVLEQVLDSARVSRGFVSRYARNGMMPTPAMASAWLIAVIVGLFAWTGQAQAYTTIQDGHVGAAHFNFDGSGSEVAGLFNLERAQVDFGAGNPPDTSTPLTDVTQQWYYYAVGGGPAQSLESQAVISTGPFTGDSDNDGLDDFVQVLYNDASNGLLFALTYRIQGVPEGGQSVSLERTVEIVNYSSNTVDLNFFDYSDLSLTQARDPSLEASNYPDYARAFSEDGDAFVQWDYEVQPNNGVGGIVNSSAITIFNQVPDGFEVGLAADVYGKLTGADPTDLLNNYPDQFGPGDLAFLVNYDLSLEAGTGNIYSAQLLIVPEPNTASVFLMGGLVFGIVLQNRPRNPYRPRPHDDLGTLGSTTSTSPPSWLRRAA